MSKLIVKDIEINIISINDEDYICITDMIKAKDGDFFVKDWLRNRNTLEYIGVWESLYNPDFIGANSPQLKVNLDLIVLK